MWTIDDFHAIVQIQQQVLDRVKLIQHDGSYSIKIFFRSFGEVNKFVFVFPFIIGGAITTCTTYSTGVEFYSRISIAKYSWCFLIFAVNFGGIYISHGISRIFRKGVLKYLLIHDR